MFSTDAGRKTLSVSAGFERLVVVALSREHEYTDMDSIKAELSSKVMELAPSSYRKGVQVMSALLSQLVVSKAQSINLDSRSWDDSLSL